MGSLDRIREYVRNTGVNRRWILILVVLLAVLLGLGTGTVSEEIDGDLPGIFPEEPDTEPAVELETPTPEETPTPDGDGTSSAAEAATPPPTPAETATAVEATDTDRSTGFRYESGADGADLTVVNDTVRVQVTDVVPGGERTASVVVENSGNGPGEVGAVLRNVTDRENSLTEPEREVDDTPGDGELSSELRVRLAVSRSGSSAPEYLYGGPDEYVPLASLAGENGTVDEVLSSGETAVLRLDFRVPEDVGNEVQSDGVSFDCTVFLTDASSG